MRVTKFIGFVFLALFLGFIGTGDVGAGQETFKLVIYGSDEDGFYDEEGNQINGKVYEVARGTPCEIIFRFSGGMDPDVEEKHWVNMKLLTRADGTQPKTSTIVKKFEPVSALRTESVIRWTAGEFGEKSLKLFCKTDCDGVDYMDNIRIKIVD